jgi:hypothetical protein
MNEYAVGSITTLLVFATGSAIVELIFGFRMSAVYLLWGAVILAILEVLEK